MLYVTRYRQVLIRVNKCVISIVWERGEVYGPSKHRGHQCIELLDDQLPGVKQGWKNRPWTKQDCSLCI